MWMVSAASLVQAQGHPESSADVAFPKPASKTAMVDDLTGFLYLIDCEHSSIWITDPSVPGRARTLVKDVRLLRNASDFAIFEEYMYIISSNRSHSFVLKLAMIPKSSEEDEDDYSGEL
jgi:hypothetical protein